MSYVLLHNSYPNGSGLKQRYCLTVSVGQESRYNFPVSSVPGFLTAKVKILGRDAFSSEGSSRDRSPSKFTHVVDGRI